MGRKVTEKKQLGNSQVTKRKQLLETNKNDKEDISSSEKISDGEKPLVNDIKFNENWKPLSDVF